MKRVGWCLVGGFSLTLIFFTLSTVVTTFFPYKDKPMMPNFFTYLLLPGLLVGESVSDHRWLVVPVALLTNVGFYGLMTWVLLAMKDWFHRLKMTS